MTSGMHRTRVIWSQREGRGRYLTGLEFLDVDAATAARLTRIAMTHTKIYPLAS